MPEVLQDKNDFYDFEAIMQLPKENKLTLAYIKALSS